MSDFEPGMPTELHPIAIEAHRLYTEAGNRLTDEDILAVRRQIAALGDDLDSVFKAVAGLTAISLLLQHSGDPVAASALQTVIRSQGPRFLPYAKSFGFSDAPSTPATTDRLEHHVFEKLGSAFTRHRTPRRDIEADARTTSATPPPRLIPRRRTPSGTH